MTEADRRSVLWLTCAAVCWRWLVAVKTPLPGVDATHDLWLAERLVAGDLGALGARWWEPLHALLLAPAVALGAPGFPAAQALACVVGGLVVVPTALAAERLRAGAGVPAAAVATVAAGSVVAAGAGASSASLAAVVACGWWAFAAKRYVLAAAAGCLAAGAGSEQLVTHAWSSFDAVRLGVGAAAFLVASMSSSAWRCAGVASGALAALLALAASADAWASLLVAHQPLLAILAGVALARWRVRLRDLALCGVALVECHAAWTLVEPPSSVSERIVPRFLQRRLSGPDRDVFSTMPRVRWSVGLEPAVAPGPVMDAATRAGVGVVLLSREQVADVSLRAALARRFRLATLPTDLQALADEHGITALIRRSR